MYWDTKLDLQNYRLITLFLQKNLTSSIFLQNLQLGLQQISEQPQIGSICLALQK